MLKYPGNNPFADGTAVNLHADLVIRYATPVIRLGLVEDRQAQCDPLPAASDQTPTAVGPGAGAGRGGRTGRSAPVDDAAVVVRYLTGQLGGGEPSHPPGSSPRQVADAVELAVVEMRRKHPHRLRSPAKSTRRFSRGLCPRSGSVWYQQLVGVDVPPRTQL